MKFNVNERLTLTGVIPKEGNFETMTTVNTLRDILYLSEEEVLKYEIDQADEMITWNKEAAERVEIEIGELGMSVILKAFKKLDEDEKLTLNHFKLYKYIQEELEKEKEEKAKVKKDKK